MTEIRLYNTRTRAKAPFTPLDPGNVRMYVCGPTVYDRAHIGNARPVVIFDVLFRLLRHVYGPEHVTYVRNVTDVDDKINARAAERGRPIREITEETLRWFHDDMAALGTLPPTHEPRATGYIAPMVAMIATLIERGHAYAAQGHVLFSVASYPDYGRLSRRALDEMQAGARVEVAPYKRSPLDFVLWKPSAPGTPGWPGPKVEGEEVSWGRPGWHIECSAMAFELLGSSFDIHGGGIDLAFPHHENERAQSMCAHPEGRFANIWMHNGFLNVEGEKMSKSLGNFFTVWDLRQKFHPLVIRGVLVATHYRKPLDWTREKAIEHRLELMQWANWLVPFRDEPVGDPSRELIEVLADDLNTPGAYAVLREHFAKHDYRQLRADLLLLGLWDGQSESEIALNYVGEGEMDVLVSARINGILRRIDIARSGKDYVEADRLRKELTDAGVRVENTPQGSVFRLSPDFDAARLEALQ